MHLIDAMLKKIINKNSNNFSNKNVEMRESETQNFIFAFKTVTT